MKSITVILAFAALAFPVHAETEIRGFAPRYSTAPANPDEPNYRPANRPRTEVFINADVGARDESVGTDEDARQTGPRRRPPRDLPFHTGRHRVDPRFLYK